MRKLTPITVTDDIASQARKQVLTRETPLSRDPKNYPVHRVPNNKKELIYVPNHTVQGDDGTQILRMDNPKIHIIQDKKRNRFGYYRCISGMSSEDNGWDTTCPLCDAASEPWELAKLIIADKCAAQGLNPDDKEDTTVKNIRSSAFSDRVLQDAEGYFTFPIVKFDTVNDDGKTFVTNEAGEIQFTVMWYSVSERMWEKKWLKALENMEDEPSHPGGMFLLLDYTYTPKSGETNVRDSARELTIYRKKIKDSEKLRAMLDQLTEDWTPEKAQAMVIRNNWYRFDDLQEIADESLEDTRNLLELYRSKEALGGGAVAGSLEDSSFELNKVKDSEGKGKVILDDTDEDEEELEVR